MTDFFTSLAERTLNVADVVQPLLAPRHGIAEKEIAWREASTPYIEESVNEVSAVGPTNFSLSLLAPPPLKFSLPPANNHNENVAGLGPKESIVSRHEPSHPSSQRNESAIQFSSTRGSSLLTEEAYSRDDVPAFKISEQNHLRHETFAEETQRLHPTSAIKAKSALLPERVFEQTRAELRHVPTPVEQAEPEPKTRASFSKQLPPLEETHLISAASLFVPTPETSARHERQAPTQHRGQLRPMSAPERENISFERAERFRKDTQAQAASVSAPTIRVNIDRIEVRAITPPAAPARPPQRTRSGPLLSLEDYLRQRNGR